MEFETANLLAASDALKARARELDAATEAATIAEEASSEAYEAVDRARREYQAAELHLLRTGGAIDNGIQRRG